MFCFIPFEVRPAGLDLDPFRSKGHRRGVVLQNREAPLQCDCRRKKAGAG